MSFYTSLNGLSNAQTDLDVIANNIANVETAGFKKSNVNFGDIISGTNPKMMIGLGSAVEQITQDFSMGSVEQTGGALDIAINGDGFFAMRDAVSGQTLYTRNGSFGADENGFINDGSDNRLQVFPTDAAGNTTGTTLIDAQIPATNGVGAEFAGVAVGEDGSVTATYADGSNTVIGKVAIASFTSPTGLKQVGSSNWEATGLSGTAAYGQAGQGKYGGLLSGMVERSNVDIAEELVGLITAQRNFQANAKAIDTASKISETIINLRT